MGVKIRNSRGTISISGDVFTSIGGRLANNCFGVRGMAERSVTDGLTRLLQRDNLAKGVKVHVKEDGTARVELHIVVEHGVNIPAVCDSIMSEVGYMTEKLTGVSVRRVDVHVDGIMAGSERR